MKYQQLENLECGWKWQYLTKKWREGENITRYIDTSEIEQAVSKLKQLEHEPTLVIEWIDEHMSVELDNKLKQAIRLSANAITMPSKFTPKRSPLIWIFAYGKNYRIVPTISVVRSRKPSSIC